MSLGVIVFDTSSNQVGDYPTIQAAIDAAGTLDGYTLQVVASDYSPGVLETVTVTKQVRIETDTNAGVDPNTGARGTEVVVAQFEIQSDNVTIDGFTVSGKRLEYGPASDTQEE